MAKQKDANAKSLNCKNLGERWLSNAQHI